MGKAKVYGKKTRVISESSYSVFTADTSNIDSPQKPVPILCERSSNAQKVRPTTPDDSPNTKTQHKKFIEVQITSIKQQDTLQSSPTRSKNLRCQTLVETPRRTSPRKKKKVPDDLNAIFSELRLNDEAEESILISHSTPQAPARPISPCPANIPASILAYLSPILNCKNVSPIVSDFPVWMSYRTHLTLEKVGEGSYGEVFRATSPDNKTVILKLMPLNAMKGKGAKSFTNVSSAANEIRLLERMQRVPGFVEFRGACVLHGTMPKEFIQLWNDYKSSGRTVESKDPNKKASYSTEQLWLLLEMSDAGRNLEPGQYAPPGQKAVKGSRYLSIGRTWDIFWEVVKAVAKAEVFAQFEHRDLHLGNVCAKDTHNNVDEDDLTIIRKDSPLLLGLNRSKMEITLIDYSLSRAIINSDENVLFYDFQKDKHLLRGEGDLQYDMYRYMVTALGDRSPKDFIPETNVIWLWFLLTRLLDMTKELPHNTQGSKANQTTVVAKTLEILEEIQEITDPARMKGWMIHSAAALLDLAIERQWFSPSDVID
jgi:serine/threonine-protein kinase haspin